MIHWGRFSFGGGKPATVKKGVPGTRYHLFFLRFLAT